MPAAATPLADVIADGRVSLDLRLRHESVTLDVANPTADEDRASALTLRTRLGYRTPVLRGVSGYLEFEDVRPVLGADDYAPETPGRAPIADPAVTELNQAYLRFGADQTRFDLRWGRQRIVYDDARFIGNVGWRQDEQTFDAVRIDYRHDTVIASAAWVTAVNGITPDFDADVRHRLLNVTWTAAPFGRLGGHAWLLEPAHGDDGDASDTFGLRYAISHDVGPVQLAGTIAYATQEARAHPGSPGGDARYTLLDADLALRGFTFGLMQETLGSDDGQYGFQTPLATKHAFNGWADRFAVTPATGLVDRMVELGTTVAGVGVTARWHRFSSDTGGIDYGDEFDLRALKDFGAFSVGLKYADYRADDYAIDTRKVWAWVEAAF